MFIELTKENGTKQIINVTQITGVSSIKSRHNAKTISNIWWAADDSPTQYVESYEDVKSLIQRVTNSHILNVEDLTSPKQGDLDNIIT
jgi:hypothetical protein